VNRRRLFALALGGVIALQKAATTGAFFAEEDIKPIATKQLKWECWPVDQENISARFGEDFGRGPHRGVDLAPMPPGTFPFIYAPAAGRVVTFLNSYNAEYDQPSYGLAVCLDHLETPWYSLYAHMSEVYVVAGDMVEAGQVIGRMGWTGVVEPKGPGGTHLHWQVCKSSQFPTDITQSVDPLSFPFTIKESAGGMDEAAVTKLIEKVLDSRRIEINFAEAMTGRIKAIHQATDDQLDERVQLQRIHKATDLANPAFNIV